MTIFPVEDEGGSGTGSYEAGLIVLPDGVERGVETVAGITLREEGAPATRLLGLLGTLRGVLPEPGRQPMPMRLAVSTIRAGLGVIEEELAPGGSDPVAAELVFTDGSAILARMPPDLVSTIRRDREIARAALARSARPAVPPPAAQHREADAPTSIFRYEKRNGRLRRVVDAGKPSKG